jgi:hypothetical protein
MVENRQLILDRYHQHTRHCSSCRQALTNIQRLQIVFLVYFALSVLLLSTLADQVSWLSKLIIIVTALVGLGAYGWLKFKLEPKFHFVDYIHAQR